jgi:hypothetical protein
MLGWDVAGLADVHAIALNAAIHGSISVPSQIQIDTGASLDG